MKRVFGKGPKVSPNLNKGMEKLLCEMTTKRYESKMSVRKFAPIAGISKNTIQAMELGRMVPNLGFIVKYLAVLGYELKIVPKEL